ncbi:UDP-N-acetylmuramoyl-L-alanine--D-glutamate ligase [Kangiella sp. TOML190]|uniref:UDP-N-acetylmuramoyl-L-alanine--D-glutamate ligase n=1 Tax=Kangiella sp. TOML190 TaxID=2931351 RepID=UPI00203BD746|nr:UDP-N-acetylmuramoyl-L-alanine--D-glutamate ligase [Kangiella sp. TOML190]
MAVQDKVLVDKKRLILGLGQTGLSVARFLQSQSQAFRVMDTRTEPPGLAELEALAPNSYLLWNESKFSEFDELVVSPGISVQTAEFQQAREQGVKIIGDIELFAQMNNKPVIAITGSNGKSTVTDLLAQLINASGKTAEIGGNFGVPALDLLQSDADFIVLELSSFQLETTYKLQPLAATILNISEDHLDRYQSYQDYIDAKQRIYRRAKTAVINHNDEQTWSLMDQQLEFGLVPSEDGDDELVTWQVNTQSKTIERSGEKVLALNELRLQGTHNGLNLAAAFALLEAADIEINQPVLEAAKRYSGLEHRCQFVTVKNGVTYINDSKATNVGATLAAIESFSPLFDAMILIAGGDAKDANLEPLAPALNQSVSQLVAFGKDGKTLTLLAPEKSHLVANLAQALVKAQQLIKQQSLENCLVLLSPACASLDMFNNYQERGDKFMKLVRALA